MRFVTTVCLSAALTCALGNAVAQQYPFKAIRFVVPYVPGGGTDTVARLTGQKLSEALGQAVVIDNRPGAGGSIGAGQVAHAAHDGYTLLVHSSGHTVNPSIFANLGYDTQKDLVGVSMLAELPNVLVVPPSKGWKTDGDLVKVAKANPGKLSYGSAGTGSGTHMNAEKFRLRAGFDAVHVPYKGPPEGLTDIMGDRIDFMFAPIISAISLIKDGRVTTLAVGSAKRSSILPDIQTTEEAGYPGSAYRFWVGMLAPAGTPPAAIERLNKELNAALKSPDVAAQLKDNGIDAAPSTPADFMRFVQSEEKKWVPIIKRSNIKVE